MLLRDSQANEWEKLHFELRRSVEIRTQAVSLADRGGRPYLHVHAAVNERDVQIINLSRANVVTSPDVEILLGVRHADVFVMESICV
jgi:predicted DNA-binding protein with PD1-like motif